jgi:hypothetical protein
METSIWWLWPWITLFVFLLLFKAFGTRSQPEQVIVVPAERESGGGCGSFGALLLIALIVGAALCILIISSI